jgi:hypothetical protein
VNARERQALEGADQRLAGNKPDGGGYPCEVVDAVKDLRVLIPRIPLAVPPTPLGRADEVIE